jgi:integrase
MRSNATGQVIERDGKRGRTFALRFRAYGKREYLSLGSASEGWDRTMADRELKNVLADVRRGLWSPDTRRDPVAPAVVPTFHVFASEWFEAKRTEGGRRGEGLTPAGEADLRWQLEVHLLPTFATTALDQIAVEDVDRFRRGKVRDGKLNATSINKCLATLAAILELAVEYGHVPRNVAKGKRRRLPAVKPPRTYLDRADHIEALLEAAGELDRELRSRPWRRALLATLTLAGLRIDEALSLRWGQVDLANGRLRIAGTKTDAAARVVDLLPLLRDELAALAASRPHRGTSDLVFGTGTGAKQSPSNVRRRVLASAGERANVQLAQRGIEPLPAGLTPHSLRRTFASLLVARGDDPAYVMAQMGHSSPNLTLSLYAKAMQRRDGERERMSRLISGVGPGPARNHLLGSEHRSLDGCVAGHLALRVASS